MNYKVIAPQHINGTIHLPSSKSIANRALIINALSYNIHDVENLSESDDTQVLYRALNSDGNQFDVGPAGTAMRFITAYLSKIFGEWIVTGSERMKNRPIGILVDALRTLGANIEYLEKDGYPPLKIQGCVLYGKTIELDGNVSSQYISALLMIAPVVQGGLTLKLRNKIISKPYIHLTLRLMAQFGIKSNWENDTIIIEQQEYVPTPFFVESDWSAASYWYQILALSTGEINLPGLFAESWQGDSQVQKMFENLGISTTFENKVALLKKDKETVSHLEIDFTDQPDLAQTLVVTCALKGVTFLFSGLQSLRIKETDRVAALINEMEKLGYLLTVPVEGSLQWNGERCNAAANPEIDTYEDHRMAMAFAPAAMLFPAIIIKEPKVVSKSYPGFWADLKLVGFELVEV